ACNELSYDMENKVILIAARKRFAEKATEKVIIKKLPDIHTYPILNNRTKIKLTGKYLLEQRMTVIPVCSVSVNRSEERFHNILSGIAGSVIFAASRITTRRTGITEIRNIIQIDIFRISGHTEQG